MGESAYNDTLAQAAWLARHGQAHQARSLLLSALPAGAVPAAAAYDLLARIAAQQGRLLEAESAWRKALEVDPDQPATLQALAHLQRGRSVTWAWVTLPAMLAALVWIGLAGRQMLDTLASQELRLESLGQGVEAVRASADRAALSATESERRRMADAVSHADALQLLQLRLGALDQLAPLLARTRALESRIARSATREDVRQLRQAVDALHKDLKHSLEPASGRAEQAMQPGPPMGLRDRP